MAMTSIPARDARVQSTGAVPHGVFLVNSIRTHSFNRLSMKRSWKRLLAISLLPTHQMWAQAPLPDFRAIGDIVIDATLQSVPIWSGGAVVALEANPSIAPVVRIFDSDGRLTVSITLSIPQADWVLINRAAHGSGGSIAMCGLTKDAHEHSAGFLALAGAGGQIQTLIRTDPFIPASVVVAPDGSIWAVGTEFDSASQTLRASDKGVIRHFDGSGKPLADFLPQSSLNRRNILVGPNGLVANSSRVGWYEGIGAAGYFEVVNGKVEQYPAIDVTRVQGVTVSGLTISEDGRVFVTRSLHGNNPQLYSLDRHARSWISLKTPETGTPAATGWLLGGSGNILVFKTTEGSRLLRQFELKTH